MDRLPPTSIEAEEAVLGSILVDSDCYSSVRSLISTSDFSRDQNKWVFKAMENIAPAIDQITVTHELQRTGKLEAVGGPAYLSKLIVNTPTSVHAGFYAGVIADTSYQRRLIEAAGKISAMSYSGEGGPEEMHGQSIQILSLLDPPGKHSAISPKEHAEEMLSMMSSLESGQYGNIPYGYRDIDNLIGGMYPGDLVILGARPSVGKSQIMLEIAHHNASLSNPVLFAAVEMSMRQVAEREVSMGTGVDIPRLRRGQLTLDEWGKIQDVVAQVAGMPLYFLCGKCSVATIRQRATVLKQTKGLKLVIVDYLQLLKDKNDRNCGRDLRERVGYISGELKNLAMELDVTVLVASQFSRDVESRDGKRPRMSDLRESGDLEQDADVILLLHRPEMYLELRKPENKGLLEVGIAKVRQGGQTGIAKLVWVENEHRYRDYQEG